MHEICSWKLSKTWNSCEEINFWNPTINSERFLDPTLSMIMHDDEISNWQAANV